MATRKYATLADLAALESRIVGAVQTALAPVQPTPVVAAAKSPARSKFFEEVIVARAAAKIPCEIHATGCNRTFSPASSGRQNHVARES